MKANAHKDFIEYDWNVHGEPARFVVDTSYSHGEYEGADMLLYCAIAPLGEQADVFAPREARRAARVENKLKKALHDAYYIGCIHMDALIQHYFYVRDAEKTEPIVQDIIEREKKLSISTGTAHEPDWLTYHALLLPDDAKYQTTLNAQMIENQRAAGDALEKVRRITLLMCFPTEEERYFFNEDARNAGFAIGEPSYVPELPLPHGQTLYILCALLKPDIDDMTTRAIYTAKPHGGELLRWHCPKMAKKSPLL